jgi:hypothetical protein
MPTVMMMMILGMRSRDGLLYCPCTALPSQAKGRGASGDLAVAPQQKLIHRGWGKQTQLLLAPLMDLSLLLFMDL